MTRSARGLELAQRFPLVCAWTRGSVPLLKLRIQRILRGDPKTRHLYARLPGRYL